MNSIRPVATVTILAVIGVGLYMVINTSDPVPPQEAADVMLEIPEIEDELAELIEENGPGGLPADPNLGSPPSSGDDGGTAAAPAWPPSPAEAAPSWPDTASQGSSFPAPALPPVRQDDALPHTAVESTQTAGSSTPASPSPIVGHDPFSAQLAAQRLPTALPTEGSGPIAALPASTATSMQDLQIAPIDSSSAYSIARSAIGEALHRQDLSQALLILSEFYGDPQLTPAESLELNDLLSQLAGSVIYSTSHALEPAYHVQAGETLADIAGRYNVTPELLAKINGITNPDQLPPGTELKVVRGPFDAVLDGAGLRLVLDGRYAGRFPADSPSTWATNSWVVQQKRPQSTPAGPVAGKVAKEIVLAPAASSPTAQTMAILVEGSDSPPNRPAVYVGQSDMNELFDILTVGSRMVIRR